MTSSDQNVNPLLLADLKAAEQWLADNPESFKGQPLIFYYLGMKAIESRQEIDVLVFDAIFQEADRRDGIDQSIKDDLLLLAVKYNKAPLVHCLVEHGANPNALDQYEDNTLMVAVKGFNEGLVPYLIQKGADVNRVNPKIGYTTLGFAVAIAMLPTVKTLVEAGADIEFVGAQGSLQEIVKKMGHQDIEEYFAPLFLALQEKKQIAAVTELSMGAHTNKESIEKNAVALDSIKPSRSL